MEYTVIAIYNKNNKSSLTKSCVYSRFEQSQYVHNARYDLDCYKHKLSISAYYYGKWTQAPLYQRWYVMFSYVMLCYVIYLYNITICVYMCIWYEYEYECVVNN